MHAVKILSLNLLKPGESLTRAHFSEAAKNAPPCVGGPIFLLINYITARDILVWGRVSSSTSLSPFAAISIFGIPVVMSTKLSEYGLYWATWANPLQLDTQPQPAADSCHLF